MFAGGRMSDIWIIVLKELGLFSEAQCCHWQERIIFHFSWPLFLLSDLDTCELSEETMLDTVTRFYLAALLKHGNLLAMAEVESDV